MDATTTIVLVNGRNPALVGDVVTFQVVVLDVASPPASPPTVPVGHVTILDGISSPPTVLASNLTLVNGQVTFSTNTLAIGTHTIIANYTSTASPPEAASSGNLSMVINPLPPRVLTSGAYPNRIALSTLPLAGPYSSTLTGAFNPATALNAYADGIPLTIVSFSYDNINSRYLLYTSTLFNVQGVIQVTHHMPSPPFTGLYSTYMSLGSNVISPAPVGTSVTLTAVVMSRATNVFNPGVPVGTVQFYDLTGSPPVETPIGGPITISNTGQAQFSVTPGAGLHTYSAVFTPTVATVFASCSSISIPIVI